ncbi:xanthine dehydrogenase [Bacterioplanes sanyensis]|uniref:Xanthine dehydrogenase n=1 Tax=Bacterioplanes sanyensis TaxID=1249553 RepID=A0A222FKA9_9GAMM|nr:XdhC family protein [Bacterioplanes sanyensis]ASP38821.1 xanthine dehydrogenase [Bacterioplanes sanyensis]
MSLGQSAVIATLVDWLRQGQQVWLATVTSTYGSSPRPAGSLLAWCAEHGHVGSLSGGCVEEDLLQRLPQLPRSQAPIRQLYGASEAEQQRYRLPCGGQLHILLEAIDPTQLAHFQALLSALQQRRACTRRVSNDGRSELLEGTAAEMELTALHWQQPFAPDYRLLIAGATDVAQQLAALAAPAGFEVTICDFREPFLHSFTSAHANVVKAMPDELVAEQFHDSHCAVVTLAHDPRVDDLALLEALNSQAFYVGAMGSLATSEARRQRLLQLGITEQQLQRLHAPIGLPIHSKTPYHIAISVLAHVLQQRPLAPSVTQNHQSD